MVGILIAAAVFLAMLAAGIVLARLCLQYRREKDLALNLANDYEFSCTYDINTGEEMVLFVSNRFRRFLEISEPRQQIAEFAACEVYREDREKFLKGISLDRILAELKEKPAYFLDFRIGEGKDVVFFQCKITLTDDRKLLLGMYNVDKSMRRELEMEAELQHQKATQELLDQTVLALASAIDAKDVYTNGHSVRVAKISTMLGSRMGYDEEHLKKLYYMAILHDIGKIGVADTIITKPGSLTNEEYDDIKLHTVTGAQILRRISVMPELSACARWHHERADGKGYPDGLTSDRVPEEIRIVSVADAYDAMTSNRSYRSIMPQDKVRRILTENRGTQFDERIANHMIAIIDEDTAYTLHQ